MAYPGSLTGGSVLDGRNKAQRAEAGSANGSEWGGVLCEGATGPSPPDMGSGALCELPQCGLGWSPGCLKVPAFKLFQTASYGT